MPTLIVTLLYAILGGCAVSTVPHAPRHGDYATYSCEELAQESTRLAREAGNRSEHLLEDDQSRRERAASLLKAVKGAAAEKAC